MASVLEGNLFQDIMQLPAIEAAEALSSQKSPPETTPQWRGRVWRERQADVRARSDSFQAVSNFGEQKMT